MSFANCTSIFSGVACHGYPDPKYLSRVAEELLLKGIQVVSDDPLEWGADVENSSSDDHKSDESDDENQSDGGSESDI